MEKLTFNKLGQWALSKGKVINFSDFKNKPKQDKPEDLGDRSTSRTKQRAEDNDRVKNMYGLPTGNTDTYHYDSGSRLDDDSERAVLNDARDDYLDQAHPDAKTAYWSDDGDELDALVHKHTDPNSDVRQFVSANSDAKEQTISKLIDESSPKSIIHLSAAKNPATSKKDLSKLMSMHNSSDPGNMDVHWGLSQNPNTSSDTLSRIADLQDNSGWIGDFIKRNIVSHKNVHPYDIFKILNQHIANPDIARSAYNNPKTSDSDRARIKAFHHDKDWI